MSEHDYNRESYPPAPNFNPVPEMDIVKKQSKLGIASFILGLVSIIGFIVCIVLLSIVSVDYAAELSNNGTFDPETAESMVSNPSFILPILLMFVFIGTSFVGLILGIVGACMKNTRKAFSIIGIVLNALLSLGFILLFFLGLLAQFAA
ncbi:hypothetical protein K0T92_24170 [Paenibacillus oenotherae]|uniref:DUF4064 domain-containing protein n=1 Tax=Paenibacillus oenotherae TaxID=1435645 RepID=A0ABS7DD33_9BACL|nr:hypothetical protein [Paenibacillus oenotherae]MBW7477811.1 hypothetical protein [Paenibacillus oenotherae]